MRAISLSRALHPSRRHTRHLQLPRPHTRALSPPHHRHVLPRRPAGHRDLPLRLLRPSILFHTPAASPQASATSVSTGHAPEGTSTAGPASPQRPLVFELYGKEIVVEDGYDIEEEYINNQLVRRTVNGVVEPLPKKK
ncbi:hypothetical protein MRX96_036114 [Rhipicephalus microplus]